MIKVNGQEIKPTIFPDKTSQVWKLAPDILNSQDQVVVWDFENEGEFIHLAQLKELLKNNAVLEMPYLPYARQDKTISNVDTFALNTFARLINSLGFYEVRVLDPHSDIAEKVFSNFRARYPVDQIREIYGRLEASKVCFPDAGATAKYKNLLALPYCSGNKARERSTGMILGYSFNGDVKNETVLIVDDICDGGATFTLLAESLRANGAKEIHLFVTHGLFSKGTQILRDAGIKRIFTHKGEI